MSSLRACREVCGYPQGKVPHIRHRPALAYMCACAQMEAQSDTVGVSVQLCTEWLKLSSLPVWRQRECSRLWVCSDQTQNPSRRRDGERAGLLQDLLFVPKMSVFECMHYE